MAPFSLSCRLPSDVPALVLFCLLAGCGAGGASEEDSVPVGSSASFPSLLWSGEKALAPGWSQVVTAMEASPVADPVSNPGEAAQVVLTLAAGDWRCDSMVEGLSGGTRWLETGASCPGGGSRAFNWDLRDGEGQVVSPGVYTQVVRVRRGVQPVATIQTPIHVLRLGVTQLGVSAAEDGISQEVPLVYHRTNGERRNYYTVPGDLAEWSLPAPRAGESELDAALGVPREVTPPWEDLETPPVDEEGVPLESGINLPSALVAGSLVSLRAKAGHTALGLDGVVDAGLASSPVPLRLAATGYSPSEPLGEDGEGVLVSLETPAPLVGRYPVSLGIWFEWQDGKGEWRKVGGVMAIPLVIYGMVGPSTVGEGAPGGGGAYDAWVEVVDQATGWVGGITRDPAEVAALLQRGVLYDTELRYDTASGASFYYDWSGPRFDLSAFLRRENGSVVNCSDCAGILATYANMMGCNLDYLTIESDFDLNFIRAIGVEEFTEYPFGEPWGGGFSYHAVVTPDDAETILDATLALDGDEDPLSAPHIEAPPDGVDGDYYLWALSSEWDQIDYYADSRALPR